VLQIGDSISNHGAKGDYTSTSNDAQLLLTGTELLLHGNDYHLPTSALGTAAAYVDAVGCTTRRITVRDQRVDAEGPTPLVVDSEFALRLDPPMDDEGTPDRLWYLGINRLVNSVVVEEGTGLSTASFCLY
jgi:hypothetical protein